MCPSGTGSCARRAPRATGASLWDPHTGSPYGAFLPSGQRGQAQRRGATPWTHGGAIGTRVHMVTRCSTSSVDLTMSISALFRPCCALPSMRLSPTSRTGTVDLLHTDGLQHHIGAVRHDFGELVAEAVRQGSGAVPRHRTSAVDDFGVWRLWAELSRAVSGVSEFLHGHGLGVLSAVGAEPVPVTAPLVN